MNVTPMCECNKAPFGLVRFGYDDPCPMEADIVVIIKTIGKIYYVNMKCLREDFYKFIDTKHTYSIFPAKDYARPSQTK